jgi:hypothetical protein
MPSILGVDQVLGSLMWEYHHFGAYPTLSHQTDINVGHLIKRVARSSPATTPRSLAKLGWAGSYLCPILNFQSNMSSMLCTWWLVFLLKHNLQHHASANGITIALPNPWRLLYRSHQNFQIEPCSNQAGYTGQCLNT